MGPLQLISRKRFPISTFWDSLRSLQKLPLSGGWTHTLLPQHSLPNEISIRDRIPPLPSQLPPTLRHLPTLRRSRDVRLLLVLDAGLLEIGGSVGSGVLFLGELGARAGVAVGALLLGRGLASVLGRAVGGFRFGFEAVDFGLRFGDVLE